jgi:hypothetical protein
MRIWNILIITAAAVSVAGCAYGDFGYGGPYYGNYYGDSYYNGYYGNYYNDRDRDDAYWYNYNGPYYPY